MAHAPHTTFHSITIHTAKCDLCNLRNKDILKRCKDCGWSICTPCWIRRGDNGAHVINVGDGSWDTNRDNSAVAREDVGATGRDDVGTTVAGDKTEARSEGDGEGREEGEIQEGEGDAQSHTVAGDTGKGKEKATETATEDIDVEMGDSHDTEEADFEKARQESLLTSTHTLSRSHGEGSSSRRRDRYNHDNLFESSGLTSNSNSSESSVSRSRSKHRKMTRKNDRSSSNTGETEKVVKQRRRPSQGTQVAVRKPRSSSTATKTSRNTGNLTARNPPTAAGATSPRLPKPKLQIRVPRARKPAPNTNTSDPTSTQTSSTLPLTTQPQAKNTTPSNQAQHSTLSSTSQASFDTTNPSIDLLLHAASVLETQPNTQPQPHPHCAQPVPALLQPESFHSESQQSQQSPSYNHCASNPSSLPELIEMKFYTRDSSSLQFPTSHHPARQHQNISDGNTNSIGSVASPKNENGKMRSDDAMRNESSESSAIIIGGNTVVAPRLRNLYWQAAIVRDKDGRRVRRFGGRG